MLLTHRGRTTGAVHHTVLEAVRYDPAESESGVFSAYGTQANWYRNIQARPPLAISTAGREYTPQFRLLVPGERLEALRLEARYRRAFRTMMRFLGHVYDGSEESLQLLASGVVMVAVHPI